MLSYKEQNVPVKLFFALKRGSVLLSTWIIVQLISKFNFLNAPLNNRRKNLQRMVM